MPKNNDSDPVYQSDRNSGSTPPEYDEESSNLVGRPFDAHHPASGFHEHAETIAEEREPFSEDEALLEGGSFDGLGVPSAIDDER